MFGRGKKAAEATAAAPVYGVCQHQGEGEDARLGTRAEDGYPAFEALIRQLVAEARGPLFETALSRAGGLYDTFLFALPAERRQHYACRNCRRFVETYGTLVTIGESGGVSSVLWDHGAAERDHPFFAAAVLALERAVTRAKVTGVFLSSHELWGVPANVAGAGSKHVGTRWTHLSGTNPQVFQHPLLTDAQMMAEQWQDFIMLKQALADYGIGLAREALRVLAADALAQSEKVHGVAKWFLALHEAVADKRGLTRDNLTWRAVATAPPGFCHVRSTIISTLLDDLAAGLDFAIVARRWAEKMHPLQYQRPTAPPTDGAIAAAEQLVEKLGAAGALARRFATLNDVYSLMEHWGPLQKEGGDPVCHDTDCRPLLWSPEPTVDDQTEEAKPRGGVFDHLKRKPAKVRQLALPPARRTWVWFRANVLPTARRLELHVPLGAAPFYGLVTAANRDAPAILQWDGLTGECDECSGGMDGRPLRNAGPCAGCGGTGKVRLPRNPVSWYVYVGGSPAAQWALAAGSWVDVTAVFPAPPHWQRPAQFRHHTELVLLALAGAKDTTHTTGGGLFPSFLKAEYHGARRVLEAYTMNAAIAGRDEGNANGLMLQKGQEFGVTLRATDAAGAVTAHVIDRWE